MKQGAAGRQLLLIRFLFLVIQPPIIPPDSQRMPPVILQMRGHPLERRAHHNRAEHSPELVADPLKLKLLAVKHSHLGADLVDKIFHPVHKRTGFILTLD